MGTCTRGNLPSDLITDQRVLRHVREVKVSLTRAQPGIKNFSNRTKKVLLEPGILQITRAADYAVRVMVYLAAFPQGTRIRRSTLVEVSSAPEDFLSKVLQRLVAARLITSHRGSGGGFELAALPNDISLLNVVEAVDGPVQLNLCVAGGPGCERQSFCAVHPVWNKAQNALIEVLNGESIATIADNSNGLKAQGSN